MEFEVYTLRLVRQKVGESMDTYQARLRALAKNCEFANLDGELKSHIIQTCVSTRLRRRALAEPTMTLQQIVDAARSMETAELQVKVIESGQNEATSSTVAAVRNDRISGADDRSNPANKEQVRVRIPVVTAEEVFHIRKAVKAVLHGENCRTCSKTGHFAKLCRSGRPTVNKSPPTQASFGRH